MAPTSSPSNHDLLLIGGGHSHALLLRMVAMKPIPGVRITLVSDVSLAPYSGMLPGHIAGTYSHEETHIDLRRLCEFAGVRFVLADCTGVDPETRCAHLEDRPPLRFDTLSINTGSTPAASSIPGAELYATAAKPVPALLEKWEEVVKLSQEGREQRIAIIGGGAGGVELALCMRQRLGGKAEVSPIHRGDHLMPGHNIKVREAFERLLPDREIRLFLGEGAKEIKENAVILANGEELPADHIFWVTNASAPEWIANSTLPTGKGGFLRIRETLQVEGHPNIFAAGDVATIPGKPRPKSGVFAVRMAKPLLKNIRARVAGKKPTPYRPQKEFLGLVGTADGSAIASRGNLFWQSEAMWKLKDRIDRKFMAKFSDLPEMDETKPQKEPALPKVAASDPLAALQARAQMRCHGCAAKVGASMLSRAMSRIRESSGDAFRADHVLLGIDEPDDAAVTRLPEGHTLAQTVDYMPSLVSDPYLFGRLAANHCLSDLFAMGARPHSALALLVIPFASEDLIEEDIFQLLSGLADACSELGFPITGGHTAEGDQLAIGLTCNGTLGEGEAMKKAGLYNGQQIILTKPLGTGTLFAAHMRLKAKAPWIDTALNSMATPNAAASQILRDFGTNAMTDVTGFGLIGHMAEMLKASKRGARLTMDSIPLLHGAGETAAAGILSSISANNQRAAEVITNAKDHLSHQTFPLLFDPQTSGGLLAGIRKGKTKDCLAALHEAGYPGAAIIGEVTTQQDENVFIELS